MPGITRPVTVDGEEALRVFVPRFPYIVFMVDVGGDLFVVAVAHERQEPGYWVGRTKP